MYWIIPHSFERERERCFGKAAMFLLHSPSGLSEKISRIIMNLWLSVRVLWVQHSFGLISPLEGYNYKEGSIKTCNGLWELPFIYYSSLELADSFSLNWFMIPNVRREYYIYVTDTNYFIIFLQIADMTLIFFK